MSGTLVLALRLGMAVFLYAFLAWGLIAIWRDVKERGLALSERKIPTLHLTVEPANGESIRRAFLHGEVTLGRDPACDLCLNDDAVSARHARLSFHHGQWWAEDLGSTNGTRLNQTALSMPTVIASGDQIECGNTAIVLSIGAWNEISPTIRLS
ncbi:MAG: FHA domain-containing protein [Chloroflexota bacterium]